MSWFEKNLPILTTMNVHESSNFCFSWADLKKISQFLQPWLHMKLINFWFSLKKFKVHVVEATRACHSAGYQISRLARYHCPVCRLSRQVGKNNRPRSRLTEARLLFSQIHFACLRCSSISVQTSVEGFQFTDIAINHNGPEYLWHHFSQTPVQMFWVNDHVDSVIGLRKKEGKKCLI